MGAAVFSAFHRAFAAGVFLPVGEYADEPVRAGRQEAWDCVPPGASTPRPLFMPAADELGDGDVYVPAGWFAAGGDPEAPDSLPGGQVWVDGFVIRRTQVTNEEYLAFLNDLVERGRESEALKWAPRERSGTASQLGALVYGRDGDGRFVLQPDTEGDVWSLDWPVLMLDWDSASAYCRWLAERTGKPWRLPGELEWEKAARGVDGRFFPWGDRSWCCMRDSHEGRPLPEAAEARPADESPYGVLGLAGNIADWCGDGYRRGGPVTHGRAPAPAWADPDAEPEELRVVRGGGWASDPRQCRAATRVRSGPDMRNYEVGFRPARSLG